MPTDARPVDVDLVDSVLQSYAEKGVFKGYARLQHSASLARYRIRWFYSQAIDITLDRKRRSIALVSLLPQVDLHPAMTRELRGYLRRMSDLPQHRRIDEARAELTLRRKANALTLAVRSLDGDLEYACRKLVNVANEVQLDFLSSSAYDRYKIEGLGVDPERIWA